MKKIELDKKIRDEMKHIGKSYQKCDAQSTLRYVYPALRRRHLTICSSLPAETTLHTAVEVVRKSHPNFVPSFDMSYFRLEEKQ